VRFNQISKSSFWSSNFYRSDIFAAALALHRALGDRRHQDQE